MRIRLRGLIFWFFFGMIKVRNYGNFFAILIADADRDPGTQRMRIRIWNSGFCFDTVIEHCSFTSGDVQRQLHHQSRLYFQELEVQVRTA